MAISESFDPSFFDVQALPEQDWVAPQPPSLSGPKEPKEVDIAESPFIRWQEHLLPLSCIGHEDNLTVLRVELETAHQLLQYQQSAIDSLSEQLTNRDLHLQHAEDNLATAHQTCDRQAFELTELAAICRDLKMQLRRQQQRVLQYRNLLKTEPIGSSVTAPTTLSTPSGLGVVSFGYESLSTEPQPLPSAAVKSPPVSAWSAPHSIDLTGPLACYRELATIRMTTASLRLETISTTSSSRPSGKSSAFGEPALETLEMPAVKSQEFPRQPQNKQADQRVELPTFTRTSR